MADIKVLREEMQRAHARAQALVDQYPEGLPAEPQLEVEVLIKAAREKRALIEQETKLAAKAAELQDIDRFLNEPVHKLAHGINGDADDRKGLLRAGWEIKANIVYAPNSLGAPVAMFGEDVLFGPMPDHDANAAMYFKQMRASFAPEYTTGYVKYLRAMAQYGSEAMAFSKLTATEHKALTEGSDVGGGFLVPPDIQAELLVRLGQQAIMRKYARVQTTSRDVLKWPRVGPNKGVTTSSIYSSGFVGGWVGETPAFADTDPDFGTFDIPIKKIRVATKLSNDLVADAAVNLPAFLAQNGAENMALVEDNGFLTGDGTALQPLGLLNAGIATVDVEGSTANKLNNTAANTGSAPKLIDLVYALPAQYTRGASWLMRRSIEGKIRGLVDAAGRFLWPAQTESGFAGTPRSLMGYPLDNSDFLPDDGTDGNQVLVFGDLSSYIIGQRAQITSVVLRELFAGSDQVGILLFERVGGAVWNTDSLRIGKV